jgi:hypothetical protein
MTEREKPLTLREALGKWQEAVDCPYVHDERWQKIVESGEAVIHLLQETIRAGRVVRLVVTPDVIEARATTEEAISQSKFARSFDDGHEFILTEIQPGPISSGGLGARIQGGITLVVSAGQKPIGYFLPQEIVSLSLLDTD